MEEQLEKCPFCEYRQEMRDKIDYSIHPSMASYGLIDRLQSSMIECCGGVVGSVLDTTTDAQKKAHHHRCAKCGKRFPEKGSYKGDFVNDSLTQEE